MNRSDPFDPDVDDFPDAPSDDEDFDENDDCGMHPDDGRFVCGLVGSEQCEFCPNRPHLGQRSPR